MNINRNTLGIGEAPVSEKQVKPSPDAPTVSTLLFSQDPEGELTWTLQPADQETAPASSVTVSQLLQLQNEELPTAPLTSSNIIQAQKTAPASPITTSQLAQDNELPTIPSVSQNKVQDGPPRRKHYSGGYSHGGNEIEMARDTCVIEQDLFDTPYVTVERVRRKGRKFEGLLVRPTWENLQQMHVFLYHGQFPPEDLRRRLSKDDDLIHVSFHDTPSRERSAEAFFKNGDDTFNSQRHVKYQGRWVKTYERWWKPSLIALEYQHFPTSQHRRNLLESDV
jgi:hypothetical protein